MPHINRIRLVDVAFNDAKSFYDDFMLVLNQKSATFDLENGGGKSVLLMMLLQVVLPNISLREDKPLKNIFLGGKDRTSHVLVEWGLDDGSPYKYLLTGFCARKSRAGSNETISSSSSDSMDLEAETAAGVEYFNYTYLYNEANENDIREIPLSVTEDDKKKTMSFDKLKDHIKQLNKKNKPFEFFDHRGEYILFLKQYNLIDTEWKIIKEINSGENSIEKYFRQNKTSRKLIENLLIKIIEDTGSRAVSKSLGDTANENALAETLIEIRENLNRFLKDKQHLNEYEQILSFYNRIKTMDQNLKNEYENMENLKTRAVMNLNKIESMKNECEETKSGLEKEKEKIQENLDECMIAKERLDIQLLEFQNKELLQEQEALEKKRSDLNERLQKVSENIKRCEAQNHYMEYKREIGYLNTLKAKLNSLNQDLGDLPTEYNNYGFSCKIALEKLLHENDGELTDTRKLFSECESELKSLQKQTEEIIGYVASLKRDLDHFNKDLKEQEEIKEDLKQYFIKKGCMEVVLYPTEEKDKIQQKIQSAKKESEDLEIKRNDLTEAVNKDQNSITRQAGEVLLLSEKIKEPEGFLNDFQIQRDKMLKLQKLYDAADEKETELKCAKILSDSRKMAITLGIEKNNVEKKLAFYNQNDYYIPNDELLLVKEKLKKKYDHVFLGMEFLQNEEENVKIELLSLNKLLPYSIVLSQDNFILFKNNEDYVLEELTEYPVPVINLELLRERKPLTEEDVLFLTSSQDLFIRKDAFLSMKENLIQRCESIDLELANLNEKNLNIESDLSFTRTFQEKFSPILVQKNKERMEQLQNNRISVQQDMKDLERTIGENKENIIAVGKEIEKNKRIITDMEEMLVKTNDLIAINGKIKETGERKSETQQQLKSQQKQKAVLEEELRSCQDKIKSLNEKIKSIEIQKMRLEDYSKEFSSFEKGDLILMPYDELTSIYIAKKEIYQNQNMEISAIEESIQKTEQYKKEAKERIQSYGFTVKYFTEQEEKRISVNEISIGQIQELKNDRDTLTREINGYQNQISRIEKEVATRTGSINSKKQFLTENKNAEYQEDLKYTNQEEVMAGIQDNKMLFELFTEDLKRCEKKWKDVSDQIQYLNGELRDMIRFIDNRRIDVKTKELSDALLSYETIAGEYTRLEDEINSLKTSWRGYIKFILVQGKDFHINEPLKALEDLDAPSSLTEALNGIRQVDESIGIIKEKMTNLLEDIKTLEKYQEQFNTQCIHRAEWILDRLKKFSSLSRIDINGTSRNMIESRFSDYSEEDKIMRMKNHIESIIKEINEQPQVDKIKIASRLSSKELLAQITDMDKASVRLYKVESVEEHSAYKRWENAVGSEGQSNALYFIFAVCLIAYIRMLSLDNTRIRSKKVMIADNPFGATSAVYLWEPMFNILAENDVQLIAPGHHIGKELTSKFEVNYLLNQEILSDHRIKVVVKDVRTEEDLDQMNFETIEQMTIF